MGGRGATARSRAAAGKPVAGAAPAGPVAGLEDGQARSATDNIRNVGTKTFYRKAERWVDSEVKPEEDAKAIVLEQFSDEFFKLARGQSAEMNQYLTFEEPVTVAIEGRVYRIDPPKAK
jgi:Ca-activated chloride channel family protein